MLLQFGWNKKPVKLTPSHLVGTCRFIKMMLWSLFVVGALMTVTDAAPDCPDGWSEYESACYKYFDDYDNFNDARDHCHSFDFTCDGGKHTRLSVVTLTNEGEREFANELWEDAGGSTTDQYGARYWIGLYKNNEGWHWDDAMTVVESELFWAEGEPNNQGGYQNCAAVWTAELRWDDRDCYTPNGLPYICEFKCE